MSSIIRRHRAVALAALGCAGILAVSGCGQSAAENSGDPETLVFASIPSEESTSLQQEFGVVTDVIEKETGKKVEFFNASDYAGVIEAQRAGKVQIAAYGPFSYVTAKDSGVGTVPVAAPVDAEGEQPGYRSYAITKPGSGIASLADMRGKTVCFVDPSSTSGYLYPTAGLTEAGIDPKTDITPVFAGGHDASALAVASGQCDAGFAYDSMVDVSLPQKGQLTPGDVEVIWKSEEIAGSPLTVSSSLSPELQERLTEILRTKLTIPSLVDAGYCANAESCALPEDSKYGYVAVEDADFDGVRKVCDVTKADSCQ
ncbi:phosphate/phosphite/phosphonate ABC transporter substrate-binding protein [Rhodococcus sp. HNM0569]|uniref:phosphate/phosphite/phosphonate ABC transporter substrate-binding protein n=1 Tax=Rhodococcus sp. HNM0569 TaxID=2716340 RepID=UPI00146CCDA1|nr:phosphate/phosphite/phosphonate ABC transporter substrate-binding protein [Rhodococcus sp. HNM0569]NLU84248.1 phosphate/phosphite/phosphonate ABC transporter substrate-binding protein [Rhodococcus sp. HNM0569]